MRTHCSQNVHVGMAGRIRAFTLVELLVVIGIIALLISMLLPALTKARQSAGLITCAAQMRQLGMAWTSYHTDNKGWLLASMKPFSYSNGGYGGAIYENANGDPIKYGYWYNSMVEGYLKTYKVVNCPIRDPKVADWPVANWTNTPMGTMAAIESDDPASGVLRGHVLNSADPSFNGWWSCNYSYPRSTFGSCQFWDGNAASGSLGSWAPYWAPRKFYGGMNSLKQLSDSATVTGTGSFGGMTMDNIMVVMDGSDVVTDGGSGTGGGLMYPRRWTIHDRAGTRMNALFIDGHVSVVQKSGVTTLYGNGYSAMFYARN